MTRFVIDAATLLHLVSAQVRIHEAHQLVGPNAIRTQALTLLLRAVRRGDLSETDAMEQHERMSEVKMRLLGDRVSRRTAWRIAQEQGWESLVEAEYVALARLQADALVTVDPDFADLVAGLVPVKPVTVLSAPEK